MDCGKKVLIADDEAYIRVLLSQTLEDLEEQGVELLLAGDGQEAMDLALDERPDLVFLDVMMPRFDGYQVCQRIKESDNRIYVILLTSRGQSVDKERGALVGADAYVTKPFDPDDILRQAAEVLGMQVLT